MKLISVLLFYAEIVRGIATPYYAPQRCPSFSQALDGLEVSIYRHPTACSMAVEDADFFAKTYKGLGGLLSQTSGISNLNFAVESQDFDNLSSSIPDFADERNQSNFTLEAKGFFYSTQTGIYKFSFRGNNFAYLDFGLVMEGDCFHGMDYTHSSYGVHSYNTTETKLVHLDKGNHYPFLLLFNSFSNKPVLSLSCTYPDGTSHHNLDFKRTYKGYQGGKLDYSISQDPASVLPDNSNQYDYLNDIVPRNDHEMPLKCYERHKREIVLVTKTSHLPNIIVTKTTWECTPTVTDPTRTAPTTILGPYTLGTFTSYGPHVEMPLPSLPVPNPCKVFNDYRRGFKLSFFHYPLYYSDSYTYPYEFPKNFKNYGGEFATVEGPEDIRFDIGPHDGSFPAFAEGNLFGVNLTVSNFTLLAVGYFMAPETGTYTFNISANDYLYVDFGTTPNGQCCGNDDITFSGKGQWSSKVPVVLTVTLVGDKYYPLSILYNNVLGDVPPSSSATKPELPTITDPSISATTTKTGPYTIGSSTGSGPYVEVPPTPTGYLDPSIPILSPMNCQNFKEGRPGFSVILYHYPLYNSLPQKNPERFIANYMNMGGVYKTLQGVNDISYDYGPHDGSLPWYIEGELYGVNLTISNFTLFAKGYFYAEQSGYYTFEITGNDFFFLDFGTPANGKCCGNEEIIRTSNDGKLSTLMTYPNGTSTDIISVFSNDMSCYENIPTLTDPSNSATTTKTGPFTIGSSTGSGPYPELPTITDPSITATSTKTGPYTIGSSTGSGPYVEVPPSSSATKPELPTITDPSITATSTKTGPYTIGSSTGSGPYYLRGLGIR
ncbi:hypothetical protein FF38_03549 [Lucilia cuprina]|uniref:PA14 domain-containing protein n=1 Tax=Lucilia cuprina TaxID=7375 RepID=A0A0L0C144_LUCCU|nr:hypothetical protein FF38_03549 [Lucilia cuprina]